MPLHARLAFLPIYFTAYETGRHQVRSRLARSTSAFLTLSGAYRHSVHHHLVVCNRRLGVSVLAQSLHYPAASGEEHAADQAIESSSA